MDRQGLITHINNCIALGKVLTKQDVRQILRGRKFSDNFTNTQFAPFAYRGRFEDSLVGSVEYNGFYIKKTDNSEIILTGVDEGYRDIDLGDCFDVIAPYAFLSNGTIDKVSGKSIKAIGPGAFIGCKVYTLDFPELIEIGAEAFAGCILGDMTFNNLKVIHNASFSHAHMSNFSVNTSQLLYMGNHAFCESFMERLLIPNELHIDALHSPFFRTDIIRGIHFNNPNSKKFKVYYDTPFEGSVLMLMSEKKNKFYTYMLFKQYMDDSLMDRYLEFKFKRRLKDKRYVKYYGDSIGKLWFPNDCEYLGNRNNGAFDY